MLAFVVRAWQHLGLPNTLQIDNSDLSVRPSGLAGRHRIHLHSRTRTLAHRVYRTLHGWLQERILTIPLHAPSQVRRELRAMMDTCFHKHIHPHLHFQTSAQVRKNLSQRMLPYNFRRHLEPLPIAIGRVPFIRRVRPSGRITILGVKFKVGKRLAHQYVSAILYTRTMLLKIHSHGRLIKQFDFPFIGKLKL
ncbi:MAG TPA: hypothetical protein VHP14_24015 [Anaerolineales bacterium]|nr:hypothetical protein [Anaerolineales bacterium]